MRSGRNGSCPLDAVQGSMFCEEHSNELTLRANYLIEDERLRNLFERKRGTELTSMRDDVALMRTMIEDRLNLAKSDAERLAAYSQIGNWMGTLDKLVNSLNRLEEKTSAVLTRETLMKVAQSLVQVIAEEIANLPDSEMVIDAIAQRVVPVIENATNEDSDR